jgi:hypothetical protein
MWRGGGDRCKLTELGQGLLSQVEALTGALQEAHQQADIMRQREAILRRHSQALQAQATSLGLKLSSLDEHEYADLCMHACLAIKCVSGDHSGTAVMWCGLNSDIRLPSVSFAFPRSQASSPHNLSTARDTEAVSRAISTNPTAIPCVTVHTASAGMTSDVCAVGAASFRCVVATRVCGFCFLSPRPSPLLPCSLFFFFLSLSLVLFVSLGY